MRGLVDRIASQIKIQRFLDLSDQVVEFEVGANHSVLAWFVAQLAVRDLHLQAITVLLDGLDQNGSVAGIGEWKIHHRGLGVGG